MRKRDTVSLRTSRWRKLRSLAVSLGLSGLITLALLEGICRILDPIGISYYPETAHWLDTMIVEDPIGYWNRPGQAGTYYGAPVSINSIGLRGPEVPPKAPNEVRVLFMGDSFPFGIGVAAEDALPAQLEARLDEHASPGIDYRVLNMGVVSYNSTQEARQLEELGVGLKPDLVVLAFAVNDIEPVMWVFDKRRSPVVDYAQRSYALSLLAFVARNVKFKLFGFSGIALGEFRDDSPRWREVERSLARMSSLSHGAGARFVVFVYDDLVGPKGLVEAAGRRAGYPVLDLEPAMRERLAGRDPHVWMNSVVDSHPNAEGNRVWSELLEDALRRADLIPTGPRVGGRS